MGRAATGGVWHSTDGGTDWTPLTDNQPTLAIGSLALDPTNPAVVYAGTGDANNIFGGYYPGMGVLKSSNGGESWTLLDAADFTGLAIGRIAVDPANSQVLLLSAGWDGTGAGDPNKTGIWRSTNAGATWTQVLADTSQPIGPDAGTDVVFDPANPSIAYAGLGNLLAVNATTASGVFQSSDNGQHWTQITALPTGSDVERVSLAVSPDGTHVYATMTDGDYRDYPTEPVFGGLLNSAIYASADGGTTWASRDMSSIMQTDGGNSYLWWYGSLISVDTSDSTGNSVYLGGPRLMRSADGGVSWNSIMRCAPVLPIPAHALAYFAPSSSSFYIGIEGGVWSGDQSVGDQGVGDQGVGPCTPDTSIGAFVDRNGTYSHGLDLNRITSGGTGIPNPVATSWFPPGPVQLVTGSFDDYGATDYAPNTDEAGFWTAKDYYASYDPIPSVAVDNTDSAVIYHLTYFNSTPHFTRTLDGGLNWNLIDSGASPGSPGLPDTANYAMPLLVSPNNHDEVLFATDRVYRSTDQLSSWTAISPTLNPTSACTQPSDAGCVPLSALAVASGKDNVLYTGDNEGNVYLTTDGGTTWNAVTAPCSACLEPITSLAIDPTNANTVYASLAGYSAGAGQHVFKSTDGGVTWADISTGLPDAPVMSVVLLPGMPGVVLAGGDAGIFATSDGGATWGRLGAGLPNVAVNQVFTDATGSKVYVATEGRGVWTLPLVATQWYFAEGYTGGSFTTYLTLANPNPTTANVQVRYLIQNGQNQTKTYPVPANNRFTINANKKIGIGWSFSMVVTSDQPIIAERPMYFSYSRQADSSVIPGGTDVLGATHLNNQFEFGYVDTSANHETYLTVLNQNNYAIDANVSYLPAAGGPANYPIKATHVIPANSRGTIVVNREAGLPAGSYSALVTLVSDADHTTLALGLVERPMYFVDGVTHFTGASDVVGVPEPLENWYFAEGFTGSASNPFSERYILSNPGTQTANATVTFYVQGSASPVSTTVQIPQGGQQVVDANALLGPGQSNSAAVHADSPILAERLMSFDYTGNVGTSGVIASIPGATDTLGASHTGKVFYFAEGYIGGQFAEYVTLENPNPTATKVTVTYLNQNGQGTYVQTVTVNGNNRATVFANAALPTVSPPWSSFSMMVQSSQPILAERPMYFSYSSDSGAAGETGGTDVIGYQGG